MLRNLFMYFGQRNFSESVTRRNLEKAKPNEPVQPPPSAASYKLDVKPTELEKKIMVWSGKFKSYDSIPPRVSLGTIDDAKSRLRIRGANLIMVVTLIACVYVVSVGKEKASRGESLLKMQLQMNEKIMAENKK